MDIKANGYLIRHFSWFFYIHLVIKYSLSISDLNGPLNYIATITVDKMQILCG